MTGRIRRRSGRERPLERGSTLAPNLAILGSTLLWGSLWIPLRQMHQAGMGGPLATTAGFLLPFVLLLPLAVARWRRIRAGGLPLAAVGFCLALSIALYAEGLVRGQVARVILLFYLTPVWSSLLGRLLLGEPLTARRLATIGLGLAGMLVIFGTGVGAPVPTSIADWMGLVAGVTWGLAMVYAYRTASRPSFDRIFVQFAFLGPLFFLLTLIPGSESQAQLDPARLVHSAPWLLAFALIWLLPVVWLTIYGASRLAPGRVAICLMLEIVVGLTTATLLTDEPFGPRELVGALLILSASGVEIGATSRLAPFR
jgi:drug/metabolite transporter (DMT)-like permease